LVLTGTNSYTGTTTSSAGTLQLGNGGTTGSVAGSIVNDAALEFNRSNELTMTGAISGTGSLLQKGTGTTILAGSATHSGGTTISAGTLQIGNGGTTGSISGNITNNAALAFDRSGELTVAGIISGSGSVSQDGTGKTVLTGANSYSGGTTITSGTLQIGNGGTSGSITGAVANDGILVFNRSDALTFGGAISGAGSLRQDGSGKTILTGTSTHTGGTTITSGTLQIGNGGTSGSIVGSVTVDSGGELTINRSDIYVVASAISGGGTFTQASSGKTVFDTTMT
ncbi:autotransporter-associated beta strand repeat-containing protein, partial [Rhizobiaceae sp. 2RAB30]